MYNLYNHINENPARCRRLSFNESLFTIYNCRLNNKVEGLWSHLNYIMYVVDGRKIWHTSHGSYELQKGSCVFVRKGAAIVEQFFDTEFCFLLFFVSDEFIRDVVKHRSRPITASGRQFGAIINLDNDTILQNYFQSMMMLIENNSDPEQSLLELKFRELILTVAGNTTNTELHDYFRTLLQQPQTISLVRVMEDNFSFNLKLEDFAKLSARSLSAFKRDFHRQFKTSPGKWLLSKRLDYSMHLISYEGKTIAEASFESGFENPSHFSRSFRRQFGFSPISVKQKLTA